VLKQGEVIIVMDFKENFRLGSGPVEVGQDFYQKTQVSCLGCAVHIGHADKPPTTHYFDVLSYSLSHDGLYVHEALKLVLPAVQALLCQPITALSFWMDCGPHFRCGEVLYDLVIDVPRRLQICAPVRLNFFAEHHGKSIVDSHFGHISRAVHRFSMRERLVDINDICSAITSYFSATESDVHPIVLETPQRSTTTKLSLLLGKNKVKITHNITALLHNRIK
jgi:hypothetical protein